MEISYLHPCLESETEFKRKPKALKQFQVTLTILFRENKASLHIIYAKIYCFLVNLTTNKLYSILINGLQ